MTERLVTTSRERLVAALDTWIHDLRCQGSLVDFLIDNKHILVVDPADPAMVERVRREVSVLVPDRDGHRDQQVIAVAWEAIAAVLS